VPTGDLLLVGHCGMKWLVSYLLLVTAFVLVVPSAGAQIVPTQTADDLVGDTVDTTTDVLGDVSQSVSGGDLGTSLDTTVSTTQQVATDALGSGTTSAGTVDPSMSSSGSTDGTSGGSRSSSRERAAGSASPGKEFRSRFDRLPPRLERLLERIELGRNVRANLRRLQQALASLSTRERARVLRLLNAEIRRLRADGVSATERKRIGRLIRAREQITELGPPAPTPAVVDTSTRVRTTGPSPAGGVLDALEAGRDASPGKAAASSGVGSSEPSGIREPGGFPIRIVLVLGAVLLAILGGLAIREEWPA
jgi:hypothetical protein